MPLARRRWACSSYLGEVLRWWLEEEGQDDEKNEASSKDFQKVYQPGEGVYSRDLAWTKWPEGVPFDGPTAELCQDHPLRVGQECHLEDEEYAKSAKSQFI